MKLLVGLGNPGPEYARTRHNVGFAVIDRLALRHAPGQTPKGRFRGLTIDASFPDSADKVILFKPTAYMNRSGGPVAEALAFFKLNPAGDLLVVVDDVYLPVGAVRIRPGGGTGGHNGLADLQRALGTDLYPRVRVGVGARIPPRDDDPADAPERVGVPPFMDQADFVLSRFSPEEEAALEPALDRAAAAAEVYVARGLDAAMNQFNAEPRPPKPGRSTPAA